jgi:hypothetical protein
MSAMRTRILVVGCAMLAAVCLTSIARAQTSWWRTYGGTSYDGGNSVLQTADGGYIVAGSTRSFGAGYCDVYLIKTNASGDTLWTSTYGGTSYDYGRSVQQTADSGYIIAGGTWSFGTGFYDVYLIKTDASGDTLWTRAYGGTDIDNGLSVQQTSDGGYIIAGYTRSFGAGTPDSANFYLIKTNAQGDTLWTRTYGGTGDDEGHSVQQAADSGYIITGGTRSFGAGTPDSANFHLIKTNAQGDTLWTRTYGGTYSDYGYSGQQTSDSGYIIAGYTMSFGAGAGDVYLIKTDASGDTQWTRTYGGTGDDEGYSVQQTSDGGYIIAGSTASFGAGSDDVYLIKTDSLGNVGVAEESPKPQAMRGRLGTTVLSGASGVRRLASCVAFDAMGRRVLHAKPGIYFLRTTTTAVPRKVLLVE